MKQVVIWNHIIVSEHHSSWCHLSACLQLLRPVQGRCHMTVQLQMPSHTHSVSPVIRHVFTYFNIRQTGILAKFNMISYIVLTYSNTWIWKFSIHCNHILRILPAHTWCVPSYWDVTLMYNLHKVTCIIEKCLVMDVMAVLHHGK